MKQLAAFVVFLVWIGYCTGKVYGQNIRVQDGYIRQGNWVAPHIKTTPNSVIWDNLSFMRNNNSISYYRSIDYSSQPLNLNSGSSNTIYTGNYYYNNNSNTIYTGSRGGNYYYNSNGNKVYVPKRPN